MAIYNNAAIGQGFSALAAAFAPPSGSDLAGYATAAAKKQEAARLAELFTMAQSPTFNQTVFDRANIATGNYNPTQSFYAQDQNNATTQRGQDVTARTSITNNTADNARALATNEADNTRAVVTAAFGPLNQGQIRPEIPSATGSMYGLPSLPQIAGQDKPLSETEVQGAILRGLPLADQQATVLGDIPVEQVIMGGKPTIVRRNDAVGQTPYDKPSGSIETQNFKAPDGTTGSAYFEPTTKQWLVTGTNEPVPANSVTFSAGLTGGTTETGLGGKFTERDSVIQLTGENMKPGLAILNRAYAGDQSVSTGALLTKGVFGDNPAIKDIAQRMGIINPTDQSIMGGINSVMNYLYLQTGAARSPGEDERGYAELVPLASDTPENRQLKRDMFNQKAMSIINQAKDPELRTSLVQAIQGEFKSPALNPAAGDPAAPAVTAPTAPPAAAIEALKANPDKAADFDALFGPGAAAAVLGGVP